MYDKKLKEKRMYLITYLQGGLKQTFLYSYLVCKWMASSIGWLFDIRVVC